MILYFVFYVKSGVQAGFVLLDFLEDELAFVLAEGDGCELGAEDD